MKFKKMLSLILLAFLSFTYQANASVKPSSLYSNYDYVIDSYDIDIKVNENNTYDITENITAYFNIYKHGIYRTIPLKNEVIRLDGTKEKNRVKISKVSVNDKYTTSKENGNYKIKIGSASTTLIGQQNYEIKYNYNIGKDKTKNYDELYYNIIGNEWDTVIGNITFTITMPKEFDAGKLGFSSGKYGSVENSLIDYEVNGNIITGRYNGILDSGEALTVRMELPEGYFVNASVYTFQDYLYIGIPVALLLLSIILWFLFGKDDIVVETVEFYPPEGFNSLEIGYLYKGEAEAKDVTSLLIYLANKGYLKIEEIEETSLFSKSKKFKLIKLKDYDGNDENEHSFLNGLFFRKDEVTQSDLHNKFYHTMNNILKRIDDKDNKNTIFEKSSSKKGVLVIMMILITIITIIGIPTISYAGVSELIMTLGIACFYIPFYAVGISMKGVHTFKVIWLGFVIFHSSIFFMSMPIREALFDSKFYLFGFVTGIICIIGMIICYKHMKKRTPYGTEILGKIKGFKNFLITAEKDKLESMVMTNPTYFFDILPYTYVLGISDKWISKFESINLQAPDWYNGTSDFNVRTFNTFINSTMSTAQSTMTSRPSSSSGGGGRSSGSSGGGSSGCGSGGGGGGSW